MFFSVTIFQRISVHCYILNELYIVFEYWNIWIFEYSPRLVVMV